MPLTEQARVMHVRVITRAGGGPDKTILHSPRYLKRHGYGCLCAFLHPPNDPGFETIERRADRLEARLASVPDKGPFDLGVVRALLRICRMEGVTIWHAHDYKSNVLGLLLRRILPLRLVTTVHGWVDKSGRMPLYEKIDRWSLRRYERVLCVSEDLLQECLACGVDAERVRLVPNAIDLEQYAEPKDKPSAKATWRLPASSVVIGGAGRLSPEKGFTVLIEAANQLIAGGHDIQVAIAGEGPQRGELERFIQTLPQPERFHLLGHVQDMQQLYAACDVFALSSIREGLPNVVLEAMAMRLPLVATRVAGVPHVIENGHNGLIVPAGEPAALRDGLRRVITSPPLQQKLGESARQTVQHLFSFAARMKTVVGIYDELQAEKRRKSA